MAAGEDRGRQRSPAYVEQVTRVWRQALDSYASAPGAYSVQPQWQRALAGLSKGTRPPWAPITVPGSEDRRDETGRDRCCSTGTNGRYSISTPEMASQPLDVIYLGETVSRRALSLNDWQALARELAQATRAELVLRAGAD